MPLPDHIGYADLYEVAPTSAIDRSGVRPLNEWTQMILDISTDISDATLVTATGGETKTLGDWMAVIDPLAAADGDEQHIFTAAAGQALDIRIGSIADPDTSLSPGIKVSRYMATPDDGGTGDIAEQLAAISGIASGSTAQVGQTVGVLGMAKNYGPDGSGGRSSDACGIYGMSIVGNVANTAIGAFFSGQRHYDISYVTAIEGQSRNYAPSDGSYNPTGFPTCVSLWLDAVGDKDSGAAIVVGNPFGRQFKVGLGFPGQVSGGKTGGVADATIRDDSNSTTVFDINGSHADGLDFNGGTFSSGMMLLKNNSSIHAKNAAGNADHNILYYSSSNVLVLGAEASAVLVQPNFAINDASNIVLGTSSGNKIGTATNQKLGFFNKTPVIQQTVGAALSTGGAETNTNLATRINDLRTALINIGLVA
jgi:hypothetical protein